MWGEWGVGLCFCLWLCSANALKVSTNSRISVKSKQFGRFRKKVLVDAAVTDAAAVESKSDRVAVAITVIKDGKQGSGFLDGAAVLAYSLRRTKSNFGFDFYAIVTPKVVKSRKVLEQHGYKIIEADWEKLVHIKGIPNKDYREHLPKSGCCGAEELIKLEAFKLAGYKKVMMLDADSVVFQNIDELFTDETDAIWTLDRFLGGQCVNGGFLVAKPDPLITKRTLQYVNDGLFFYGGANTPKWGFGSGWNATEIGYCYGGQTFQGLVPFYYRKSVHNRQGKDTGKGKAEKSTPGVGGELIYSYKETDSQLYNNMASDALTVNKVKERNVKFAKVKSCHFTNCQKPWTCPHYGNSKSLCRDFHENWWVIRNEFEKSQGLTPTTPCINGKASYKSLMKVLGDKKVEFN